MILSLEKASQILRQGGVVCFPTETVYGLGAVATSEVAVNRVYEIKNRPRDNPLICHFYSLGQAEVYASEISDLTRFLIENLTPGPVSFMINLPRNSPLLPATCGLTSMLARIPDHELTLELIREVGLPIAGPSANTSGKFSGTDVQMIQSDFGLKIDGILDGGPSKVGLESTILDARGGEIIILRQGAIGENELEVILRKDSRFDRVSIISQNTPQEAKRIIPGNKYKHYSPITPVLTAESLDEIPNNDEVAILLMSKDFYSVSSKPNVKLINMGSNLQELARDLYRNLYRLDQLGVKTGYLVLPALGNSSLARAISEKLERILERK